MMIKKNVIERIIYNSFNDDYRVLGFYFNSKSGGTPVMKHSFENINGEIHHRITSEIDSLNHLILNKHYNNNIVSEIDSIFYIKDFLPVEILKSFSGNNDKAIRKIAYLENDKMYKEVYKKGDFSEGTYIRYNDFGKRRCI